VGRIAVVDIGTNTTRVYVADVVDGAIADELERFSTVTRLGAGVDVDGSLNDDAIGRVYKTLDRYQEAIDRHGADKRVAVLTSAVRDASNGQRFADAVRERYGLTPHVLTGDEEARLTFLGATSERDPNSTVPTLVIDVGGGSTELVIGHGREAHFHVSTQAGVVRQTERHIAHDPPTQAELEALALDVRGILSAAVPAEHRQAVEHAIAVAGTATSLAAIAQELDPYDPQKVHGYVLDVAERDRLAALLAAMTNEQRCNVAGLDPARAPTIVAGVIILTEAMTVFGLQRVEVSEHDILRGAALGL
jgi:exopolyphosphatase/guanosine-5'-triphosphate,3'-diphosphate pyrophosphatase